MNRDIGRRIINQDCSILSALELMEQGETRTLYRCDLNGVLLNVVTEGDLRRLLLGGEKLDSLISPVESVPADNSLFVSAHVKDNDSTVYDLLIEHINKDDLIISDLLRTAIFTHKIYQSLILFQVNLSDFLHKLVVGALSRNKG